MAQMHIVQCVCVYAIHYLFILNTHWVTHLNSIIIEHLVSVHEELRKASHNKGSAENKLVATKRTNSRS